MTANIALSEAQFRTLVSGGKVEEQGANGRLAIRIILSDIGYERMRTAIADAENGVKTIELPAEDAPDKEEDAQARRDWRRQQAIEKAVSAADRIIMNATDGSVEELNYLTAMVANKWAQKACQPMVSAILKKDLGL